jgi:glycosyltransferase involved in cell wall biosynthesis
MMDVLIDDGAGERSGSNTNGDVRSPSAPVHCFPSGVDLQHFAKALDPAAVEDSPVWDLPTPRYGYFGAIDERMDWDIVTGLAAVTDGSVILAGPILREPPGELPDNVHLMGPVEYERLPELLAGFDVCLIPFRNSSLVEFVSPTKTPEYLAGGRPVVSTPIPDVVADYGDLVRIAATPEDFAAACIELAAQSAAPEILARESAQRARTWDQIAGQMDEIITGIIESGERV